MNHYRPHVLPKVRSKALMAAMKELPCTLRISGFVPGHACSGQDTVVGCHLPVWGKGHNTKVTDMAVVAGCGNCHALVDGVDKRVWEIMEAYPTAIPERMLHALTETHAMLIQRGIIEVKNMRIVE